MVQTITDAYMTQHLAQAESIDFNTLLSSASPWQTTATTTNVTVGTLPNSRGSLQGGQVISGTLVQIRVPITLPTDPNNPAGVESWHLQSHLTYNVTGGRSYVKSRNTVRTR